jgi:hypothetical protein
MTITTVPTAQSRVRTVLASRGIDVGQINDLLDAFDSAGLFVGSRVDALHAARDKADAGIRREAAATCKRLGIKIDNGAVDQADVDRKLAGHDVASRMGLKSLFAAAGLLR